MKELMKISKKFKVRSNKLIKQFDLFKQNYANYKKLDANVAKIYEITFFFVFTNVKMDKSYLETEYRIKYKIFKNAFDDIKESLLQESLQADDKGKPKKYICNLYSIREDLNDYYD